MTVHVIAIWTAPKPRVDEVRNVLRELAASTLAEEGCLRFEVWEADDLPGRFVLMEEYRGESARLAHLATDYFTSLVLDRAVALRVERDVRVHRQVEPADQPGRRRR